MTERYPEPLDQSVYWLRSRAVRMESSILTPGVMEIMQAWWAGRRSESSLVTVSEPGGARDEITMAVRAWHVVGRLRAFSVAAETGHRLTDVAAELGYRDVRGIALGDPNQATIVVGSHTATCSQDIDNLLPEIVNATNEQLREEGMCLQLPLHLMLASNES